MSVKKFITINTFPVKKHVIASFFILFLVSKFSIGQYISQEQAQIVAQVVLSEISENKSLEISKDIITIGTKNQETLYVFNSTSNGFVIISAEKRAYPILAYSNTSTIHADKRLWSPSFSAWLNMYSQQIEAIRSENTKANSQFLSKWDELLIGEPLGIESAKGVAPLLTTTWDQGCGYNALCPEASGGPCGRVYTGCVATAMAQVMRYMEHPSTGVGSQCYTTANYGELCADFESAVYDYSSMSSSSGNAEVAELMYHCGVSVYMNYSPSGSGAYSQYVVKSWKNFFDYKNHILISKGSDDESDWNNIIRNEIDNSRPIYYAGFGSGGHAFVFDGYQGADHFHVNWGWGGAYNGYFYVNDLTPGGSNFTNNQQAIVGALPSASFSNLDVSSAVPLNCAVPVSGDISAGVDYINYYKNSYPPAVGKELVYTFTTDLPGRIRVKITNNIGGDVNTFLLSHPHQDSLVTYGKNGFTIDNTQPATYYLAVEGDKGKEPTFDIEVICPSLEADLVFANASVSPRFIESLLPNVMFTSSVKNIGNTDAGSCTIEYYLSTDNILDGADILLGTDMVPALAANESQSIVSSLTMPAGLTDGDFQIIFVADRENAIVESDDDNFAYCYVRVPEAGSLDCSSAVSLIDGEWFYGNTETNGVSNVEQYWSASNMTGPEVVHSFVPLFDGFAKVSYIEKNPGRLLAIILPICNENTYLSNIWFSAITDTIGFTDLYVTAGSEYFIVVDGENSVLGEYALKVDLPQECPNVNVEISGKTDLCDGDSYPSMWTQWGANRYQWYKDNVPIPEQTDSWFSPSSVGNYHLEMTENGCTSSSEIISVQMSFPPDTAQISSSGDLEFCQGSSVELSLSNVVTYPFNWAINGDLIEGATQETFNATEPGVYSLITQNGSCSVQSHNSITVDIKQLPADIGENLPIPSDNISFYYTFDNDNSDLSGNENNFSCWGFEPVNDRFDNFWQARYFTSGDVFGYTQRSSSIPDEFTLSLWFKTISDSGGLIAAFTDNLWSATPQMEAVLYMANNGKLHYYISNSGSPAELISANAYNDNQWHMVTIAYDGQMRMTINSVEEVIQGTDVVTKESYTGYWVFAGKNLPANVASMPTTKHFDGSLDEIILLSERNDLLDHYNFTLPSLGLNVLSNTANCMSAEVELSITNSEFNTDYRLWNETTSEWLSDAITGNFGSITLSGNNSIAETSEIRIFAQNQTTNCEVFLDTTIIINVFPETSINVQPEGGILCEGGDFTLSVDAAGQALSYQWEKDGLPVGSNSQILNINNAQIHDSGDYYCIVSGYCGEETTATATLTVLENPLAVAGTYSDVCGNSIQLNATNPTPFTGEWNILEGNATIESSTTFNTNLTDAEYGDVTLSWIVTNDICQSSDQVTITFIPQPLASFSYSVDETQVSFSNLSQYATSFQWNFGDGVGSSTYENPEYQYSEIGSYTVTLTSYNEICSDIFSDEVEIHHTSNGVILGNKIAVYPNPFSSYISLSNYSEVERIVITNLFGQLVMDLQPISESTLSTSNLIPGIYVVEIYGNNGKRYVQLIVKH